MILENEDWLNPQDAWKLRNRLASLKQRSHPELVIASWLSSRGQRLECSAPAPQGLLDDVRASVVLHAVPMLPPQPIPGFLLVADLVDHGSDRDVRQAREILAGLAL